MASHLDARRTRLGSANNRSAPAGSFFIGGRASTPWALVIEARVVVPETRLVFSRLRPCCSLETSYRNTCVWQRPAQCGLSSRGTVLQRFCYSGPGGTAGIPRHYTRYTASSDRGIYRWRGRDGSFQVLSCLPWRFGLTFVSFIMDGHWIGLVPAWPGSAGSV